MSKFPFFSRTKEDTEPHLHLLNINSPAAHSLTEGEVQSVINTLSRIEQDIANIKGKLRGDDFLRRRKQNPALRPWITNNLLLITIVWQIANVVVLELITGEEEENGSRNDKVQVDVPAGVMMFFMALHLLLIIVVSIKLAKQVLHRTVSGWFMIQSYLSTVLLFGGIYALIYRISGKTFVGFPPHHEESQSEFASLNIFLVCQYFSVTTMTTVGFGEIYPKLWPSYIVVCIQILLSVVYTTVIFAKGLSHFSQKPATRDGGNSSVSEGATESSAQSSMEY